MIVLGLGHSGLKRANNVWTRSLSDVYFMLDSTPTQRDAVPTRMRRRDCGALGLSGVSRTRLSADQPRQLRLSVRLITSATDSQSATHRRRRSVGSLSSALGSRKAARSGSSCHCESALRARARAAGESLVRTPAHSFK